MGNRGPDCPGENPEQTDKSDNPKNIFFKWTKMFHGMILVRVGFHVKLDILPCR